jgi:polyhydroxybutyrate depolymerase
LPSAGCGNAGVAGYQTLTIPGTPPRSYDLLVPTPYDPARPLALVFVFHAAFGNSVQAESWGLQNAGTAATDGIFVFPQGIDFSENGTDYGIGWNEHCDGYDMPFFDAMAQYIESNYCVDTNRVFATGFSWGADFTNNLGCCRGDKLRAVAPASGADGDYNPSSACASRMPAFRITYGDQDGSYPQAAFDTVVNLYRSAHQCSTASDAIPPPPCIAYRGCDQPVLECKYAGMGHDLPPGWSADVWSWLSTFQ